tara:strand:+ start:466 stop:741 length:276 start_codon:yes stop_codon:yes gene_type:complete
LKFPNCKHSLFVRAVSIQRFIVHCETKGGEDGGDGPIGGKGGGGESGGEIGGGNGGGTSGGGGKKGGGEGGRLSQMIPHSLLTVAWQYTLV